MRLWREREVLEADVDLSRHLAEVQQRDREVAIRQLPHPDVPRLVVTDPSRLLADRILIQRDDLRRGEDLANVRRPRAYGVTRPERRGEHRPEREVRAVL